MSYGRGELPSRKSERLRPNLSATCHQHFGGSAPLHLQAPCFRHHGVVLKVWFWIRWILEPKAKRGPASLRLAASGIFGPLGQEVVDEPHPIYPPVSSNIGLMEAMAHRNS